MLIIQKRIHNLEKYIGFLKKDEPFYIGVTIDHKVEKILKNRGLDVTNKVKFLPNIVGPVSRFNAEGKEVPQKQLPKETCFREQEWHRKQFAGRGIFEEHSKICYIPYERYPRKEILPPSCEFNVIDGRIVSDVLDYNKQNHDLVKHVVNLFLELFGFCELLNKDKMTILDISQCQRLSWIFIDHGWKGISEHVNAILKTKSVAKAGIIKYRLDVAEKLGLSPVGIGTQGFRGYIAFQGENKSITVFENYNYGNAIYISDSKWAEFSQKNKSEILGQKLQIAKIVHNEGREKKLKNYC